MPRSPCSSKGDKGLAHPALTLLVPAPGPRWRLRFDGSCFGNGSAGAAGKWADHVEDGPRSLRAASGWTEAPAVTNNVSEWSGLLHGLRVLAARTEVQPPGLLIEGDSQLVVRQLTGEYAAKKADLIRLRDQSRDLLAGLSLPWAARWIAREENAFCDELTKEHTPIRPPAEGSGGSEPTVEKGAESLALPRGLKLYVVGQPSGDPAD